MTAGSAIVLAGTLLLVGFTVWRNLRKGAPCSCGCSRSECGCSGGAGCACRGGHGGHGKDGGLRR